jgi:hypothetical protein
MRMAGLALLAMSWSAVAAAQSEARVLLIAPAEAELTARILGQTRDLGVTLEVADGAAPQSSELAALAGRARAAAIVVWTEPRRGIGLDLYVLRVDNAELRARHVSTPEREALASSTTAEMAALVVRSELAALLSELKAERERAQAPPQAPTAPAPEATALRAPAGTPAPVPATASRSDQPPWRVLLAYRPSRPFRSAFAHALALGVRRDLRGFALGLGIVGSLPLSLHKSSTEIRVNRLQLRLEGLKHWDLRPELRVALGVAAGLSVDFRSTRAVAADLMRTGDAVTFSGTFGLLAHLDWAFSQHVGAMLALGADVVPWRTEFVYRDGPDSGRVARLSWLDIWALVGFFTRFGG